MDFEFLLAACRNVIIPIAAPLQIDSTCRQASCHFDKNLFGESTPGRLAIPLPPALDRAVPKRKAEFIAGRFCAREALRQLDSGPHPAIGIGPSREPLWPAGFVGSITHTLDYAGAVVASKAAVRAVGIDAEAWIAPQTAQDLAGQILTSAESDERCGRPFASSRHYLTLMFSAKESLFKCLFPLARKFFGFQAVHIVPEAPDASGSGNFRFELLEDLNEEFRRGYSGVGRYGIGTNLVHTAVVLRR